MSDADFTFNFGPISRTLGWPDADGIGFASLPIHEVSTALLGAQNKDEFIAWLLHDTFKALFTFRVNNRGRFNWEHFYLQPVTTTHYLRSLTDTLANNVGISPDYIHAHQLSNHAKQTYYPAAANMLSEPEFVSNEFGQHFLGEQACFVQLSFRCQPTANSFLLRLAVMEAFLRAVSGYIAQEIASLSLGFSQVCYVFYPDNRSSTESQIASLFDVTVMDDVLTVYHFVPSLTFEETSVHFNLTDFPPDLDPHSFALMELLTVYRDDLTIIMALPLFIADHNKAVIEINRQMQFLLPEILEQLGIKAEHKAIIINDIIALLIDEQLEIRQIDDSYNEPHTNRRPNGKALHKLMARPYELMADNSLDSRCLVCGSPTKDGVGRYFKKSTKLVEAIFSDKFTDFEHIGFDQNVCPMCLIYASNANKKSFRGSLAILSPSTSLRMPFGHDLIEQPRFDRGGRFDPDKVKMLKTVVTLQELILLTAMSRRILQKIMAFDIQLADNGCDIASIYLNKRVTGKKGEIKKAVVGKFLAYTGAYFLYDISAINQFYRTTFLGRELSDRPTSDIWQTVQLTAYPFEIQLSPSFTMLLELRVNAKFMNHASAHTLLKVAPTTIFISPDFSFHVLVDNSIQEAVSKDFVEAIRLLDDLGSLPGTSRYDFTNAVLSGEDPITAAYQSTERPKKQKKKEVIDFEQLKVIKAKEMSEQQEVMGQGSIEEMWTRYTQMTERLQEIRSAHPTLVHFASKPKKKGA